MTFEFPAPLRRIGKFVQNNEKLLLALLAVVIVVSGGLWYREYFNVDGPAPGGTYVDGIIGGSAELDLVAAKLTKTGLFSVNGEGEIENQLIENWTSNSDKTKYTFDLKVGVDNQEIVDVLNNNAELFGPGQVDNDGDGVINLNLLTPNPNLPLLLAQPLFDYGPYKLSKKSDTTAIFTRNTSKLAPSTFINKIVVHAFADEAALKEALERKKIDGAAVELGEPIDGYKTVRFENKGYYAVVTNVNRPPFRNLTYRRNVVNGLPVAKARVTLTVANEEPLLGYATQVKKAWEKQGMIVTLNKQPIEKITNEIGPSRDFEALLTGISYLPELDPFYLWDSSQIRPPGNNLSGIKDSNVDQQIDKIQTDYNLLDRATKINQLHKYLRSIGVLQIVSTNSQSFIVGRHVVAAMPYLPLHSSDRWQSITQWYLK